MELKLNELIAAVHGASNRLIDVEELSEHDIETLHHYYAALAKMAHKELDLTASHSIEEAYSRHEAKLKAARPAKH